MTGNNAYQALRNDDDICSAILLWPMARRGAVSESLFCGAPFAAYRFESVVAGASAGEQAFHSGAGANYGCHIAFTSMALAGDFYAYHEAGVGLVFWRIVGG